MAVKSEVVGQSPEPSADYPCIKKHEHSGLMVLFEGPRTGVAISGNTCYKIGSWSSDWAEYCFRPFHGTVTLSNE
jgi:hypothetical protein